MKLKQLSINDGLDVFNMLQDIGAYENEFNNEVNGMSYEEYRQWLKKQNSWSNGDELPEGYVRQWTFWLYDENKPVGYGKLRERVTEESKQRGGNIGFAISSQFRGKGYGDILFGMLLEKAKEMKIDDIFSTVEKYNYPSKHIHEKHGGKLVEESEKRWFFVF